MAAQANGLALKVTMDYKVMIFKIEIGKGDTPFEPREHAPAARTLGKNAGKTEMFRGTFRTRTRPIRKSGRSRRRIAHHPPLD